MQDTDQIAELLERAAKIQAALEQRTPSKADLILGGGSRQPSEDGHFFATVARAQSMRIAGSINEMMAAKAELDDMGSTWADVPADSKATLGNTDAAGGYLVPNNVVAAINLQATPDRDVVDLLTVIGGVRGSAVDVPWEDSADSRAVIASPGSTKENANFIVGSYTATLYTLARIFDVGNQLLRQSAGAAEQLVRAKLASAVARGEDYYAIQGTGSSEPYGLLTAIGSSGPYVSTFSSPADNTVAGSVAAAIATAAGALENRGARADGAIMNTADWWRARRQGTDEAGFLLDPTAASGREMSLFGIRVRHSPNVPSDTIVVGEFRSALFFRGAGYRVDVSSEAGDRWDKNLTGFRGESEIAFDARPAVYTGRFQRIVNAVGA